MRSGLFCWLMTMQQPVDTFIGSILSLESTTRRFRVEDWSVVDELEASDTTVSCHDLGGLALACDRFLLDDSVISNDAVGRLWSLGFKENCVAATTLAMGWLESGIRYRTGYATGRAPLLKTMISELPDNRVLSTLLLPEGLNLRNLLWHGFLGDLPRAWLALVLVLLHSYPSPLSEEPAPRLLSSQHDLLSRLTQEAPDTIVIREWLPSTHRELWDWITTKASPAVGAALSCLLLEHGLRQEWAMVHDRPEDGIARQGHYYVTLDGVGRPHNLLLHREWKDDEGRVHENRLIDHIGGSVWALLSDLFASPRGGPNIRAAFAHGLHDGAMWSELSVGSSAHAEVFQEYCHAIWVAMTAVANRKQVMLSWYRPVFSYAAVTARHLRTCRDQLSIHSAMVADCPLTATLDNSMTTIASLDVALVLESCSRLMDVLETPSPDYSMIDVQREFDLGEQLSRLGLVLALLDDIACMLQRHGFSLSDSDASGLAESLLRVATFAMFVVSIGLGNGLHGEHVDIDVKELTRRTRMMVSTFDNFLFRNTVRSYKAVENFSSGRPMKDLLRSEIWLKHTSLE